MHNIIEISKLLPIKVRDKELNLLTDEDIFEYSKILKSDYYNEYIDNDFSEYTPRKIRSGLLILSHNYRLLLQDELEVKLLLKDTKNSNIIYGGVTLQDELSSSGNCYNIEIGYWINEKYKGNGLATEMLRELIKVLRTNINIGYIICNVQEVNRASLRVLAKLGFKNFSTFEGPKCKDIELRLNPHYLT